jgi:hypothetical protein
LHAPTKQNPLIVLIIIVLLKHWLFHQTALAMNALGYPKLKAKSPIPSDIVISQQIVKEVGLLSITDVAKQ